MTQICNNKLTPKKALKIKNPLDQALDHKFFKVLSDPTRLKLLTCLSKCQRPCTLSEIAECCSVDLSVVSRHMLTLAQLNLVNSSKSGRTINYISNIELLSEKFLNLSEAFNSCKLTNTKNVKDDCCG